MIKMDHLKRVDDFMLGIIQATCIMWSETHRYRVMILAWNNKH